MGSLRLRGALWWARWYVNGRRFERSTGTADRCEAERFLEAHGGVKPPAVRRTDAPIAVYVISDGEKSKIGVSVDSQARVRALQTGNALPVALVTQIVYRRAFGARCVEHTFHRKWKALRLSGEWFAMPPDLAARELRTVADQFMDLSSQ